MKSFLKSTLLLLSFLRLWPHLLLYLHAKRSTHLPADVRRWKSLCFPNANPPSDLVAIVRLMSTVPEFRNLFYYRCGLAGKILSPLCPPLATLQIATPEIGPGLYIQHGIATIIAARKIGANCWINQQVTIGYSDRDSCPTIGDDVTIAAGAKVIGNVTVGDRVVVGANAVVVKNVPADVTVVGGVTRIVRRNGLRVDERL